MARDNEDVEDGWLCDKGRYGYQAVHSPERITQPLVREGGALREASWERALDAAAAGLEKAGAATAALAGGETTNEEGFLLQRLLRDALGSPHIDSRPSGVLDPDQARDPRAARPERAGVGHRERRRRARARHRARRGGADLDLRVRKARRRRGAKVVVASSHPTTLDANADARRPLPARRRRRRPLQRAWSRTGTSTSRGGGPVVVIWGERLSHGAARHAGGRRAARARAQAEPGRRPTGAGLIEIPTGTNGRGLREVGCLPNLGPGLADAPSRGQGRGGDRRRAGRRPDRARAAPRRPAARPLRPRRRFVVAFADHLDARASRSANVVFPAASYAEKEGTMTHPDGRLQRLRQAIGHPGEVRQPALVLAELCSRLGTRRRRRHDADGHQQVAEAVPFYAGLTLDEIGGRGVRWQERDAASALERARHPGRAARDAARSCPRA